MLGNSAARRRTRRALVPWLLAGVAVWLAVDTGPALLDECRLRGSADTGSATVLSTSGARPRRASRRLWDDLVWGGGRSVTYRFAAPGGQETSAAAVVTHDAADRLQQGGTVAVRYLAANPAVYRIEGEPGLLRLSFRLMLALAFGVLAIVLLRAGRSTSESPSASSRALA